MRQKKLGPAKLYRQQSLSAIRLEHRTTQLDDTRWVLSYYLSDTPPLCSHFSQRWIWSEHSLIRAACHSSPYFPSSAVTMRYGPNPPQNTSKKQISVSKSQFINSPLTPIHPVINLAPTSQEAVSIWSLDSSWLLNMRLQFWQTPLSYMTTYVIARRAKQSSLPKTATGDAIKENSRQFCHDLQNLVGFFFIAL